METKKILIIEDDEFSLALLERNLLFFEDIDIDHHSTSVEDAKDYLSKKTPDIIFLDIELPDGKGFDIIPYINGNPTIVVLTGNESYAFTAFENGVFDFLKKPFTPARFKVCMNRIEKNQKNNVGIKEKESSILFIKSGTKQVKINLDEVLFAEAVADYAKIYLQNGKQVLINLSLKELIPKIQRFSFVQVHRSYVINTTHIDSIENDIVFLKGKEIPVGKTYKVAFFKLINK